MNTTFDTLKAGDTVSGSLDHLINQMALIARAGKFEYGLSQEQMKQLYTRFFTICNAYPEVKDRVFEASKNNERFWEEPSDSVLKRLHAAGILKEGLGIV